MKVRAFVILSSLLLCSWLTATFVRVVPMDTYSSELSELRAGDAPVDRPVAAVEQDNVPIMVH